MHDNEKKVAEFSQQTEETAVRQALNCLLDHLVQWVVAELRKETEPITAVEETRIID
jgi:hypothetical protein